MTPKRRRSDVLILLLEPDPWRSESLRAFLAQEGYRVETALDSSRWDLALVNLCVKAGEARGQIERLRGSFPETRVLVFLPEVDANAIFPCLLMGVKGVLPYDARPDEVVAALNCVLDGSIWTPRPVLSQWIDRIVTLGVSDAGAFTPSERRVLAGVGEELSNKEIARRLGVAEATVKFHIGKLLRKTGTRDRRELARFVRESVPGLQPER